MIDKYFIKINEQVRDMAGKARRLELDVRGLECHPQESGRWTLGEEVGHGEVTVPMAAGLTVRMTGRGAG